MYKRQGLQFSTSTINPATGAVDYCIEVAPANSTGFDAFAHFTDGNQSDGTDVSGTVDTASTTTSDAIIKVVIGSDAYFIPAYTAANTTGSW